MSDSFEKPKDPRPPEAADPFAQTRLAPSTPSSQGESAPPAPAEPHRPPAPGRIGRYEILGEIARGGMGIVYRARQEDAQRVVALKVLLKGEFASDRTERRFLHEAELAAQLVHPNIVAVYDIGRELGRRFYTMELVEGKPLGDWGKGRPLKERLKVLAKVCRAVHHAHMKGIIHRDLKPGNILVTEEGEPKILDFGLAKLAEPGLATMNTLTGQTLGTPYYMAPEQADGRVHDVDIRSDIWALGVILFQTVTGEVPFPGSDLLEVLEGIQNNDPPPFRGPADLGLVALKALEKERSERYPTAEALAEDIERFLAGDPVSARPRRLTLVLRRWIRRHPASAAGVAVALLAVAAAIAWTFTRPGELRIAAGPAGAWIRVDGRDVAERASVEAGRHQVTVGAPGHETVTADVYVERGESLAITLEAPRSTGILELEADEDGTAAWIGGQAHGLPLTGFHLPVGDHRVVFRCKGCESRERTFRIGRNAVTKGWVSMAPSGYRVLRIPDTFDGPVTVRDVNGDGTLDASAFVYGNLYAVDGRTGEVLRAAHVTIQKLSFPTWASIDWDRDGTSDDATIEHVDEELRIRVWSGREPGATPAWNAGVPEPRVLWDRTFAVTLPGQRWSYPAAVGGALWVPFPGRIERLRAPDGASAGTATLPGEGLAQVMAFADGSAVLAWGGGTVACFETDGRERWRVPGAPLEARLVRTPPRARHPIPCSTVRGVVGLDPATGETRWEIAAPWPDASAMCSGATEASAGEVYWHNAAHIGAWDAATGAPLWTGDPLPYESREALALLPGYLFYADAEGLVLRSAGTGAVIRRDISGGRCVGWPAAALGPAGPEFWGATEQRRLVGYDATGRRFREVQVDYPPRQISPCTLDADGRTDLVLVGYGLQLVKSSRVLWRRRAANQVRARPVVTRIDGRAAVVLATRWEDGTSELRAFRGDTGEILWRFGRAFDVMHEPALGDWDGDGTDDVFTNCREPIPGFYCVSGRTGAVLAEFAQEAVPYPPALLRDLDGDGKPEILAFEYPRGLVARKAGRPEPLWTAPTGTTFYPGLLADLDGAPAVLCSEVTGLPDQGRIHAAALDGTLRWTADLDDGTRGGPFLHDLDGDGKPEIGVPGPEGITFLDRGGKRLARWEGLGGGSWMGVTALDDGGLAMGTKDGVVRVKRDGAVVWRRMAGGRVTGPLGLAQVPGEEHARILGAGWSGDLFCLDAETGEELWRMPLGGRVEHGVRLADLDGDEVPEVLVGGEGFTLYAVDIR